MSKTSKKSSTKSSETAKDAVPENPALPPMVVNGQYIKDLSFEAPGTPAIFARLKDKEPEINVNVNVNAQGLEKNLFEIVLHIKSECKTAEDVAFICELVYGGVFTLNVPQEHLEPMLLIECPRMLFPFARNIVADVTRDGGFPPLLLNMVDFVAMYQKQLQEHQTAGNGGEGAAEG